ncbi:MAG: FecR family protein [Alphaproteobacteria bacterium]
MTKLFGMTVALSVLASATFGLTASAQEVGKVELVRVYGYETPPSAQRAPIYLRDRVVADTVLETVADGRLDVRFVDETKLIVGPSSKVKIDKFVIDPNRASGEVTLNVSKGLMRFVSGRLASSSYKIKTPTATMGVRGTDFIVSDNESGETTVSVTDGTVDVAADGGESASVSAGSTASTSAGSVSVGPSIGLPAIATASFGLDDSNSADDSGEAVEEEENDEA